MNAKSGTMLLIGVWIGLVFGLSFVEAPLKFQAPGISTQLGLGIGKLVFGASNKIQIGFLIVLLASLFAKSIRLTSVGRVLVALIMLIVAAHTFILLPLLDNRVDLILSGEPVPHSYHHVVFVLLEVIKLISLIILFFKIESNE